MERQFDCKLSGFSGYVKFNYFTYPVYMAFQRAIKTPSFAEKMAGDDLDLKAAYTTFWAGMAVLEEWAINSLDSDGNEVSIPRPINPEDATTIHWSLFEWFRIIASNYIVPEVNPSQKKLP